MRTYGRVPADPRNPRGPKRWIEVQTTREGFNDDVYITALAQTLLLNINESPFWGNFGIPARQSIMQQIAPDFYMVLTQQYYSQFFASLIVTKEQNPEPHYRFSIVSHFGFKYPDIRVRGAPI